MIANSGVIAPLPYSQYSHGSSGSGLTHFSPNNEVFLGRFLPFFAHCVVGFCWYRWCWWLWLPWWVWRQWCPITPLWQYRQSACCYWEKSRVGMEGGWRGQSENTEADTWQETVIIWLEDHRRSSPFVDWLQRHRFALFEFLCVLFTSYFWVLVFWFFECHMLPPTSCFFIIFPGSILCVASHTSIFSLWGPPLCETNTNTMSWSWGKVIKQLSI